MARRAIPHEPDDGARLFRRRFRASAESLEPHQHLAAPARPGFFDQPHAPPRQGHDGCFARYRRCRCRRSEAGGTAGAGSRTAAWLRTVDLAARAQSAQLAGDRAGAETAFKRMLDDPETRVLGLRGLFVEARRRADAPAARLFAEEAYRVAPGVPGPARRCSNSARRSRTGAARWKPLNRMPPARPSTRHSAPAAGGAARRRSRIPRRTQP